jgi:hypothetical protein
VRCLYCLEVLPAVLDGYSHTVTHCLELNYSYNLGGYNSSGTRYVGTDYACWQYVNIWRDRPTTLHRRCRDKGVWCMGCTDKCVA